MLKYYIALFLVAGIALYYVFTTDPCSSQLRQDFSARYPDYEFLYSGAGEASANNVQCHMAYEKPGSKDIYEDVWLYQNSGSGWEFAAIISSHEQQYIP